MADYKLTADDIPAMIESPQFAELPHPERLRISEKALSEAAGGMAGQWNKDVYKKWGQFSEKVRNQVASLETTGDKAKDFAGKAGGAIKDALAIGGTQIVGLSPVLPNEQGGVSYQIPGETSAPMVGANVAGLVTGIAQQFTHDEKPVLSALDSLKKGIDEGDFFDAEGGFDGWIGQQNDSLRNIQAAFYKEAPDAESGWNHDNSLLGNRDNLAALQGYLQTRSPQAWQQLRDQVLKTPGMRRLEIEKQGLTNDTTLGKALKPEARGYIQEASDPVELLGTVLTVGAGNAAVKAGKTVLQRAGSVATGVLAEMGSEQISAMLDNPYLTGEQRLQVAKDSLAATLGLMGAGATPRVVGKGLEMLTQPGASKTAVTTSPGANPFAGPIDAPPQPRDGGGVVAPSEPAPQQVPPFQDDPLNTPVEVGSGNLIADYGIAKTPEAQAIAEERERKRLSQVGKLQGLEQKAGNSMPVIPDSPLGGRDILDFVNENPLLIPRKGSEQASRAENDWRETWDMPQYYRKYLASSERGHNAADLAQMAFEGGYIQEPTADALMAEMKNVMRARTQYRVEFRKREKTLQQEEKHVVNFEKSQASRDGKELLSFQDVQQGDKLTIDGHEAQVKHIEWDEDGYMTNVVIEDGRKFGVLSLDPQTRGGVFVDEWKPKGQPARAISPADPATAEVEKQQAETRAMIVETDGLEVNSAAIPEVATRDNEDGSVDVEIPLSDEVALSASKAPAVRGPLPSMYSGGGVNTPAQTWTGKIQTLHGIRQHLLKNVGLPAVGVGRFSGALGIYRIKPEAVRLQAVNDIPVLAHEVGHHIHFRVLTPNPQGKATDWAGRYDNELMVLGRPTSTPQYTPDMVRKEGVAEFTRLWLTDPAYARAQAPVFSAFWESEMQLRNPKMAQALRDAREMIADYIVMPAFAKAKSQVVFDPMSERPRSTAGDWLRSAYAKWVDTLSPALNVVRETATIDPSLEASAKDVETWMENHRGGWSSKAHADIFQHQTDLKGKRIGKGMKQILSKLQPGDHEAFSTYLALKRAQEIERQGKRSGFENAHLPPDEMRDLEARFEGIRQDLLKWANNSLQLLVDSGLLDSKSAALMRAANRDYVPFYRLYERVKGVSFGPENSRNAGGYVDLNSGIKRLKGSDRAVIDPLQSLMKNAYMFRKLAEQNHIGVQFFDLIQKAQGYGKWSDALAPRKKATKVSHETVVKKLISEGVIQTVADLPADADLTLRLWEAVKKPDSANGEVIVFKDGERQHWEVKDALLLEALKTADADAVSLAKFLGPTGTKALTLPTRVLRFGATGGPWFAVPNFIRDQLTAGIQSRTGYVPFWDGFKGMIKVWKEDGTYQRWVEAGGKFHGVTTSTEAFTTMLEDALPKDTGARQKLLELGNPRNWGRMLGAASQLMEEATRVQEFARGVSRGMTEMEAANSSKIVSLNFARAGERGRALNMLIAFTNAKIQELDTIVKLHLDPKRAPEVAMKGVLYITVPSVLCWLLGKDDEEIQALPEWRKNLFWNINLGPVSKVLGRESFIVSLPKPFLMGAIYGTSVERALDYATGRDPNGLKKAFGNLASNGINPFEMAVNVAGLKPIVEMTANYDFFRGRSVVPDSMKNLPPEAQYDIQTSQTARLLGGWMKTSPMMIDHAITGYFATAGRFGTDALDWGLSKLGLADIPPAPRKDLMELPVLNRFAGSPYASNGYVERFYKAAGDMEGKLSIWNKQSDQMTQSEQQKWWKEHGPEVGYYERTVDYSTRLTGAGEIRSAQRALSEIGAAMKEIQGSRTIDPDTKRTRMMELARQRNSIAEKAFKGLFPETVQRRVY